MPSMRPRAQSHGCAGCAEIVAILALIAATALIMAQVVAREIFVARACRGPTSSPATPGSAVIFLVVPMLLAHDEHVKVDMFLNMLPTRTTRASSGSRTNC